MTGNGFGNIFRITTWGESHGKAVGVVIDGCPSGIKLDENDIQKELDKRKPGQSALTTARDESDTVYILSGVFEGKTTGTPISLLVWNKDANAKDYENLKNAFRPSHADFSYNEKYGFRDYRGGGRSSARETIARVAGGAIAKKILQEKFKIKILGYVKQVYTLVSDVCPEKANEKTVESNAMRCPDEKIAKKMIALVEKIKKEGDSVGGVIECVVKNVPAGLGEPVFDRLEAELSKACLSIPATKGFEIGSGFSCVSLKGSEHNDIFIAKKDGVHTKTNRSGGVQGGISNGEPIVFRVAFKPTATIYKKQKTVNTKGKNTILQMKGRHDPCVLPRAVPIVEAMTAIVILDMSLLQMRNRI